jgi:hypothetical protein
MPIASSFTNDQITTAITAYKTKLVAADTTGKSTIETTILTEQDIYGFFNDTLTTYATELATQIKSDTTGEIIDLIKLRIETGSTDINDLLLYLTSNQQ